MDHSADISLSEFYLAQGGGPYISSPNHDAPHSMPSRTDTSTASIDPGTAFVLLASDGDLAGVKHDVEVGHVDL